MDKALTDSEIMNALNHRCNIIKYSDIHKLNNIYELLGEHLACVILYEKRPRMGHWVCCFLVNRNRIEFFDSYGIFIDDELNFIDKEFKKEKNMTVKYLSKLIKKSNIPEIEYNQYVFQELKKGINTCGRHCVVRLLNRRLSLDEYANRIDKTNINPDRLVTILTKNI